MEGAENQELFKLPKGRDYKMVELTLTRVGTTS